MAKENEVNLPDNIKCRHVDSRDSVKVVMQNTFLKKGNKISMDMDSAVQKFIRLCIAQCKMSDNEFYEYKISAIEMSEKFNIDIKEIYKKCDKWTDQAMSARLIYKDEENEEFQKLNLFNSCTYKSGVLTMQLNDSMKPYFLHVKKKLGFTQYALATILGTKGRHTIPIFDIFMRELKSEYPYADKSTEIYLELDELREKTGCEKRYKNINDFKKRVLDPSFNEIEKALNIKIEKKDVKKGRAVVGFTLTIWSVFGYARLFENNEDEILYNYDETGSNI